MADLVKTIEFLRAIEQRSKSIKQVASEINVPIRSVYALVEELKGLGCPVVVEKWGRRAEYRVDQWAAISWLVGLGVGKGSTEEVITEQDSWIGWPE